MGHWPEIISHVNNREPLVCWCKGIQYHSRICDQWSLLINTLVILRIANGKLPGSIQFPYWAHSAVGGAMCFNLCTPFYQFLSVTGKIPAIRLELMGGCLEHYRAEPVNVAISIYRSQQSFLSLAQIWWSRISSRGQPRQPEKMAAVDRQPWKWYYCGKVEHWAKMFRGW